MERLLTRPSQISGNPVTSLMLITSTPLSANSFMVPPVAITCQPSLETARELHHAGFIAHTD